MKKDEPLLPLHRSPRLTQDPNLFSNILKNRYNIAGHNGPYAIALLITAMTSTQQPADTTDALKDPSGTSVFSAARGEASKQCRLDN
jgi:hypothetical protein